jgi:hypothetical protein
MKGRLTDLLRRFSPQHVATNPVLAEAWQRSAAGLRSNAKFRPYVNTDGSVNKAALANLPQAQQDDILRSMYAEARGEISEHLDDVAREIDDAFGTLTARVSGLPEQVQVHHLLYKAHFPADSINPWNLILALRKRSGALDELHDLMHLVSAGAGMTAQGANRWRVILDDMRDVIRGAFNL